MRARTRRVPLKVLRAENEFFRSLTKDFTDDMDYCLENTADEGVLPVTDSDAATLYSRVTHVLVKAQLSFELASGTDDAGYTTESDFFRYKGVFYTKKSLLDALRADAGLTVVDNDDLELVSAAGQSYCKGYEKGERVAEWMHFLFLLLVHL